MRLLYVDDHLAFRRLVIRLFLTDHQTTTAGSLADARALLGHTHFDVVLLDYDLPDGKGLELLPDIRRFQSGCRIIAVSAQPENNAILVAAGADAQLPKANFCRIGELLIKPD